MVRDSRLLTAALALGGLVLGAILHLVSQPQAGNVVWAVSSAVVLGPLVWSVLRALLRRDVGVDAIALIAIATALGLGQYLAAAVVALMMAGGNALEAMANRRARRELEALVKRAPRIAHRRRGDVVEEVPVDELAVGDRVVVRAGEVVPVDGVVEMREAVVDESALTGEPLPATRERGESVRSGTSNAGAAFELRAVRPAAESTYAALVRLVREAEASRAPFVRLADRYAAVFLPLTLLAAGVAWGVSGDPVRALAVLVVATPCPLILAAPVALVSGVSRAARAGVIVKGAGVIEVLGRARTVLLDKTGTLTLGTPRLERVVSLNGVRRADLLRLAASLDQLSAHSLAEALVRAAHEEDLPLSFPEGVREGLGQGIEGRVDGRRVAVGSSRWLRSLGYADADRAASAVDAAPGQARVLVGIDGELAGALLLGDHLRADAGDLVNRLRNAGIRHVALVSGDQLSVAAEVAEDAGIERVYAEQEPEQKLDVVRALQRQPELAPVTMVGDGVNDAPALALADVGIAMGTAGSTVAAETADAVIAVDRIDRVADAVRIGRRSLGIAKQSVVVGIALSLVAMGFAGAGFIPPVAGALLQEVIDVAVILNALRALSG